MILQFGKYKGRNVRDVPEDYLRWMIDQQQKTLNEYQAEIIRRQSLLDARLSWAERLVQAGSVTYWFYNVWKPALCIDHAKQKGRSERSNYVLTALTTLPCVKLQLTLKLGMS